MSRLEQAEFKVASFCALGAICTMVVSGSAAGDESPATVPAGYSTSRTGSLHDFDYFGRLDPVPVVGGFQGNRGEFYAADHDNGRPVKVRYTWEIRDRDHAPLGTGLLLRRALVGDELDG